MENWCFIITVHQNYYTPQSLKYINDTREELCKLYLNYIINSNEKRNKWKESELSIKEKIVSEINSLTQEQFQLVTEVNDHQRELRELLYYAITNQKSNSNLEKLVLKAGLVVNNCFQIPHPENFLNFATFILIL